MFKGSCGLLVTLLGAAIVIAGAFFFGFQGQRDDAETSRAVMTHAATGEMPQAHALQHASISERHSVDDLARILAGMETYTTISFPSISFSTSNGRRSTELTGTGTTDGGCESDLHFVLRDGEIMFFDITPFFRSGAGDA